jgi:hypothetical protein
MQELITSFLVQNKKCSLPGIGKFNILTKPAELDVANKRMLPPTEEISFSAKAEKNSEDLIKYLSFKKNILPSEALESLLQWCTNTKEKINKGEKLIFGSLGNLQKNNSGNVIFQAEPLPTFYKPVRAERVIHKDADHAILVGDKETTSSAMNQYLHEQEVEKNNAWKISSIVLLVIALILLAFHFYSHPFSLGNQSNHITEAPPATYSTQ